LEIDPSFDKDLKNLGFTWKLISFQKSEMQLKLIFDNP